MKFVTRKVFTLTLVVGSLGGFVSCAKGPETAANSNPAPTPAASGNTVAAGTPAVSSSVAPKQSNDNSKRSNNDPQPQIGSGGNDFALYSMTRAALSADAELSAANIVIEAKSGVVTLNGTVKNVALKAKAEQLAKAVAGVKDVKNRLRVAA